MKKFIAILLVTAFCAGVVMAQDKPITGNEWLKLNKKDRAQLVSSFIRDIRKQGVVVSQSAVFYCKKLDSLYSKNPNLLSEPTGKILKTAMIMEYDWKEKGLDPDALAKEWLGAKVYNENKGRLSKK